MNVWTVLAKHSVDAYTCKHTGCTQCKRTSHERECGLQSKTMPVSQTGRIEWRTYTKGRLENKDFGKNNESIKISSG